MTNFSFQTNLVKRMYNVRRNRIHYAVNADNVNEISDATSRERIRSLIDKRIITIKPPGTTVRKVRGLRAKRLTRKRAWMIKTRGLRAHWRKYRDKFASRPLTRLQIVAFENLGVPVETISEKPVQAFKIACKIVYLQIIRNNVKNRNYLCSKLGIDYADLY